MVSQPQHAVSLTAPLVLIACVNTVKEPKVLAHLRHSDLCRQNLIGRKFQCTKVPGTGSTVDKALSDGVDGALPFMHGHGPLLPSDRRDSFIQYDNNTLEALYSQLLDYQADQDLVAVIRQVLQRHPLSWTVAKLP